MYTLSYAVRKANPRNSKSFSSKPPLQGTAYQALARLLKQRAAELGLSVRDLAARLKRPRTTVHKTLCGQRRLDPIEFLDWCDALELKDPIKTINSLRHR